MRNKKEQKSEQDVMLKDWTNLASKTLDNEELATINGGDGCCWWNPLTWFSDDEEEYVVGGGMGGGGGGSW